MAKIAFTKLDLKVNNTVKELVYTNSKEEEVIYEVKYYLPIKEKLEVISNIINLSSDDNGFYNPMRIKIFTVLEIIFAYTNLNFTAKQKEDPFKLYDLLLSNGIYDNVIDAIWEQDIEEIKNATIQTIDNIYKYKNSVVGVLETVTADHDALNFDAAGLQQLIGDPNNLSLLKDVLAKLG
jgi:hypothetical protein